MSILMNGVPVSADIPQEAVEAYKDNYHAITHGTGRLLLFSCDQKLEHLNRDFHGPNIDGAAQDPEHLFRIADQGSIGAMAVHFGLLARYARMYQKPNYIIKLNGKTSLIKLEEDDPLSMQLWDVEQVMELKESMNLPIRGIGITLYLGSAYESTMLHQAAQAIYDAHQYGLVTVLWVYIRGKSITNDRSPELIAGAAGVAASLGADFVKIKSPHSNHHEDPKWLKTAVAAAGTTKVVCSGGSLVKPEQFLLTLHDQINSGGTAGCATGRNIFQRSLPEAIAMTHAIAALVFNQASVAKAFATYEQVKEEYRIRTE